MIIVHRQPELLEVSSELRRPRGVSRRVDGGEKYEGRDSHDPGGRDRADDAALAARMRRGLGAEFGDERRHRSLPSDERMWEDGIGSGDGLTLHHSPRLEQHKPSTRGLDELVPSLRVGMPPPTLRIFFFRAAPQNMTTRSVGGGIPTQSAMHYPLLSPR